MSAMLSRAVVFRSIRWPRKLSSVPLALPGSAGTLPVMPPGDAAAAVGPDGAALPPADGASAVRGVLRPAASGVPGASGTGSLLPTVLATSYPEAGRPSPAAPSAGNAAASPAGAGDTVALRALQATWVQAVDGSGQTLMARLVPAGESVELTAQPPVRLRIGNASGTELSFRGQRVDLTTAARDNIANITLP